MTTTIFDYHVTDTVIVTVRLDHSEKELEEYLQNLFNSKIIRLKDIVAIYEKYRELRNKAEEN